MKDATSFASLAKQETMGQRTINVLATQKRLFLILRTRFARGGEFARFSGLEEDKGSHCVDTFVSPSPHSFQ